MTILRIAGAAGRARGGAPLLAAPANVAAPPTTQPPVVDPSTLSDVEYAKWWIAPLVLGFNFERWSPVYLSWRGDRVKTNPAYYEYLKGLGVTHIRMFFPYRPSQDMMGRGWLGTTLPPLADINEMIDAAETVVRSGLKLHIDATDVVSAGEFEDYRSTIETHLDRFVQQIAARGTTRFPPSMVAVGAFNELELDPGSFVNEVRLAGHRILRARLPGYVLATGGALWNGAGGILDPSWVPPPDKRCFVHWHDYTGPNISYIQGKAQQYQALSDSIGGIPIIGGEVAAGPINFEQSWLDMIDYQATYWPLGRATYWALNEGKYYSHSISATDLTLRPEIETAVKAAVAKVKASPAWIAQQTSGTGTGGGTTDPGTGTGGGTTGSLVRGRPVISGGTVKSEIGTKLRGVTMALDGPGSTASTYTLAQTNWQKYRDLGFNVVRVPFSVAYENLTLAQQLPDLDKVVANASATGMYAMLMLDGAYGVANYTEFKSVWPTVCARYKDNTNVFFEMNNEPHWQADEFGNAELDEIAAVYSLMRSNAPNSMIGIFTPAAVQTTAIIDKAQAMTGSRGVTYDNTFVAIHVYGTYSRANVEALKDAYPCMLTETVSGGPNNSAGVDNEIFKIGEMEAIGVSWQVLQARFGEVSNVDTPYSNDEKSLTDRILPGLRDKGITWAADALSGSTGGSTGGGTGGTTPTLVSVTGDIEHAVVGQATTLTINATGVTTVDWVIVAASYAWRSDPVTVAVTNNTATISFTPVAGGDFVKVMLTSDHSVYIDSAAVPAPAGTGGGTSGGRLTPSTTVPTDATWLEEFSNNNSGKLNHTWGDASLVSYTNGIMRIAGRAGHPDRSAVGVMGMPSGASAWFGLGLYQVRLRNSNFLGTGDGSCSLLWPADDVWPGGEEDMGEWWNGEGPYFAHHWRDENGKNQFEAFFIRDAIPNYDPSVDFHTYSTLLENGRISFYLDTTLVGTSTNNVMPVFAYGGVNRTLGAMNRSNETWIEVDWMSFTAL